MQKTIPWRRNILAFMGGQAISLFGSSLVQFAITWYITLSTGSGASATISILCGFLPMLVLTPFAGVWADRYDRRKLIIYADSGIALSTLVLAILFMSGYQQVWLLYAVSVVRSIGSAIQNPAVSAILPQLVPEEQLTKINGYNSSVNSVINMLAPVLSGALMGFLPMQYIFFIDVITAIIAVVIMLTMVKSKPQEKIEHEKGEYFKEMTQGFRYIGKRRYLRDMFIFAAILCAMATPAAFLTPLQVTRTFGGDVWRLTVIEIAFSVGMLLGGLIMAWWGGFKNKMVTICLSSLGMGLCTIALSLPVPFFVYAGIMVLFGIVMAGFNTPAVVFIQEQVENAFLGRVFGVMTMINTSMMPLAMLFLGPLADKVAIEWLLLGTGIATLITCAACFLDKPMIKAGTLPSLSAQKEEAIEMHK